MNSTTIQGHAAAMTLFASKSSKLMLIRKKQASLNTTHTTKLKAKQTEVALFVSMSPITSVCPFE